MIETLSLGSSVPYGPLLVAIPIAILAEVGSFSPCCLPLGTRPPRLRHGSRRPRRRQP